MHGREEEEVEERGGPATHKPTTDQSRRALRAVDPRREKKKTGNVPFSSPLGLRKSCGFVVASIHLSAVLSVSRGRKARWTLEGSASAAAPAEGCFFIIVRLQTDAA